jgi:hypothetical protein
VNWDVDNEEASVLFADVFDESRLGSFAEVSFRVFSMTVEVDSSSSDI